MKALFSPPCSLVWFQMRQKFKKQMGNYITSSDQAACPAAILQRGRDGGCKSCKYSHHSAVFGHGEAGSHTSSKAKPSVHLPAQRGGPAYCKQDAAVQRAGRKEPLCTCHVHLLSHFLQCFKLRLETELKQPPLPTR